MNDIKDILLIFLPPAFTLTGVFLGFWIAWRCLKDRPLVEKEPEPEPEEEEHEEPEKPMTDDEIDDGFEEI